MRSRFILHLYLLLLITCLPEMVAAAQVITPIVPGLNVTAVTQSLASSQVSAFPLLTSWQSSGVVAIEAYDPANGKMLRAELDGNGNPAGNNFPLAENSALFVYATTDASLSLGDSGSCSPLNLAAGFNLASFACFPNSFPVSQFLNSIGLANISSISRLDGPSGRWQTAAVDGATVVGDDFPLLAGEGYIIHSSAISGWMPTLPAALGLTPATLTVWQGEPGATLTLSISAPAPTGGSVIDLVSSNPALVGVATPNTIPQGETSVSVPLTLPDTGSVAAQTVTVTASRNGMTGAQTTLSVRPKPTINLSPLTTLTGLTFSYLLTINLNDIAPPGGFPVTLSAVPAGVVSVPASVTIPAGANSTQVTVTATTVGSATISATSPGRGISGSQNVVTVKPIQTMNYGPLTTSPVGVQVGPAAAAATSASAAYGPVESREVGVAVGPVITGISPNHGAIGSTSIPVTVTGYGLNVVTGISFLPAAGITVGAPSVSPDGLSATIMIDIAANAVVGDRTVLVTTATGTIKPTTGRADTFMVTLQPPEIYSVQPLRSMVGQNVTMTISGKNFGSASSVDFIPSTGILVNNPPTVSPDGTTITVSFALGANAALGDRVVTVTTPGGTSTTTASVTNTFTVTSDPGATYSALVSNQVGILVQIPAATTTQQVPYGPTASLPVGVTVGSVITSVSPISGAIGSTNLVVHVLGAGLSTATGISFQPSNGITIQPGSFAVNGDGDVQVTVDIDANAPVTPRTVLVALSPGGYALPTDAGSNLFRVTLPKPEIYSVQPIRAMVGQSVAMSIFGKNFGSATSVDFSPSSGIAVNNPPTVNADGTMITCTFTIAANATLGDRVVTVTTPGGTTATTASTANTFSVTSDQGTTYMPLLSPQVGVLVSVPVGSNSIPMSYGPVASTAVGVMVTPVSAPTTQSVDYTPVVSTQVGVAVGGVLTGFSPVAMEPGSSVTYTLSGTGLDAVTAINVVPASNLTVTAWSPAVNGRSGTVTITADANAAPGKRTLVPMAGSTALSPSAPGSDILLVGYKPSLNSITTNFPASSVLANVGTTVTLTLNGVHLQGTTKVEVFPPGGIIVDNAPTWFSDGTGEHVSVTIIIDANASASDRLVLLTTPYGSTSATPGTTNTLSIFKPLAGIVPDGDTTSKVAANETPVVLGTDSLTVTRIVELCGLSGRKLDVTLPPSLQRYSLHTVARPVRVTAQDRIIIAGEMPDVSRGPPEPIG
jgi:hypothetical protein